MHDHPGLFPLLPSKPLDPEHADLMLEPVQGTIWQTPWEYVLTHTLTDSEGSAFWHGANLVYEAMKPCEPVPTTEEEAIIQGTSMDALLTTAYQLTHRMHAARGTDREREFRLQRDVITAEVKRRCEEDGW